MANQKTQLHFPRMVEYRGTVYGPGHVDVPNEEVAIFTALGATAPNAVDNTGVSNALSAATDEQIRAEAVRRGILREGRVTTAEPTAPVEAPNSPEHVPTPAPKEPPAPPVDPAKGLPPGGEGGGEGNLPPGGEGGGEGGQPPVGKLPEAFPGLEPLTKAGLTTFEAVRGHDFTASPVVGVGPATLGRIQAALKAGA